MSPPRPTLIALVVILAGLGIGRRLLQVGLVALPLVVALTTLDRLPPRALSITRTPRDPAGRVEFKCALSASVALPRCRFFS